MVGPSAADARAGARVARPVRDRLRRLGAALFIGAAFLFLARAVADRRAEVLAFEWEIAPLGLVASVAFLIAALLIGVEIWRRVLGHFDVAVGFAALARVWFLSSLGRYIPGKIWQFVGVAELGKGAALPALVGVSSLLVYMGFVVLAAWIVGIYLAPAAALGELAPIAPALRVATPAALLFVHPRPIRRLTRWATKFARMEFAPWKGTWRDGLVLLAACTVQWLAFGIAFHLFVASVTSVAPSLFPALTAAYALAFLAGYAAIIVPAGLGAKEGALTVLLASTTPLPLGVSAAVALGARLWSIAGDVIPALVLLRSRRAGTSGATQPATRGAHPAATGDADRSADGAGTGTGTGPAGPHHGAGGRSLDRSIRFYEERYAAPPGAMRDYRLYLDLVEAKAGQRVLDVGCGEGFFLEAAARAGLRTVGVEIVESAIRIAREREPAAGLAIAAGEALPFATASMDRVTCLGSLEHFADPAAGAREVARVLTPHGRALIVVPNRRFLGWRLIGRRGTEQQAVGELLLDRAEWQALLEAAGLRVLKVVREPWHTKPFPSQLKRIAARAAWHLLPLRWTYQFAFTCERA